MWGMASCLLLIRRLQRLPAAGPTGRHPARGEPWAPGEEAGDEV